MGTIARQLEERRERIQIRTYSVLCILILLVMGFYSYTNFQNYSVLKQGAISGNRLAEKLKTDIAEVKGQYENEKKDFDKLNKVIEQNLTKVFPYNDDYTTLTRQMDLFEESLAQNNSPFEVSNIEYQSAIEQETYSILPLRMTIHSSSENFTKFLHLIETSGAFDGNVRLMDISSIRLSFGSSSGGKEEIIDFNVQINAYFQK